MRSIGPLAQVTHHGLILLIRVASSDYILNGLMNVGELWMTLCNTQNWNSLWANVCYHLPYLNSYIPPVMTLGWIAISPPYTASILPVLPAIHFWSLSYLMLKSGSIYLFSISELVVQEAEASTSKDHHYTICSELLFHILHDKY